MYKRYIPNILTWSPHFGAGFIKINCQCGKDARCNIMPDEKIVTTAMAVMDKEEFGSDAYDVAAWAAWNAMTGAQREALNQLLDKGPVWDGDICSKVARDDLLTWGLAVRCCFRGEQGHTAASYRAYTIRKAGLVAPVIVRSVPRAV